MVSYKYEVLKHGPAYEELKISLKTFSESQQLENYHRQDNFQMFAIQKN